MDGLFVGMKKESKAACGCWFGLVAIIGPTLLFVSYRVALWIYDYHESGGHHFGGADFAVIDAFVTALLLGPLLGVALGLLTMLPEVAPRRWIIRSIAAIGLACIPIGKFTSDVLKYRARNIRIKEAFRRSSEEFHASIRERDSEQPASSDGDKPPK